jgi:hypothetical protein
MDSHISEFSYGYALTSELIALFNLKTAGAPEFATQNAEGKPGGGWDIKLPGVPFYLQFKRAARMVRKRASEARSFSGLPIYRMYLHRRDQSDQHRLLLDLEAKGNVVLYAPPGFSEPDELNEAYSSDQTAKRSIFVRPSAIGPLKDNKRHWVSFQVEPLKAAFRCSEPVPIPFESLEILVGERLIVRLNHDREGPKPESFGDLATELLSVYERLRPAEQDRIEGIRRLRQRRDAADFARLVARTLFQCELLFVPSS